MTYVGIGLVKLQSHLLALDHLLSESRCLFAEVLNGSPWVLGLWCVHTNEADPLFVLQNQGVTIYNPSNSAELRLTFSKWVDW